MVCDLQKEKKTHTTVQHRLRNCYSVQFNFSNRFNRAYRKFSIRPNSIQSMNFTIPISIRKKRKKKNRQNNKTKNL